jgi:aspartyl-tRNA(Asn)/glutamyl-tRNA(Gln) amidotransferase subunit A
MPVGLQLIGNYLKEAELLNVAHRLQQATDFHARMPPQPSIHATPAPGVPA